MKAALLSLLFAFALVSCDPGFPKPPPFPHSPSQMPHKDPAFLGMGLYEAEQLARQRNLTPRVVRVDDVDQPITEDFRANRVNFVVKQGKVRYVTRG